MGTYRHPIKIIIDRTQNLPWTRAQWVFIFGGCLTGIRKENKKLNYKKRNKGNEWK